jgi:hypothetical protein
VLEAPDSFGLEYLYYLGHPLQVTPDVIKRNFPGCRLGEVGQMDLFSDMFASEFDQCPFPTLHLGRRVGRIAGHDIIINAEFNFTTWSSGKKFDAPVGCRDYQRLASRGLEGFYTSLPVLTLEP